VGGKKKEDKRWEKKAMGAKKEKEVWEIINRERNRRKKVKEKISMEEWEEYFRRLLGGEGRW